MKLFKKNKDGITLIALVLSIILILILAGVSISSLIGQNGILNRTTEAVKKTNEAAVDEKIKMIIANYNIEKTFNSNLTFKEFCEKNENNLEGLKIIDENSSKDIQFIAEIDNRLFIMKNNGSYVLTKGKNLVRNGFGENGNTNFEIFDLKNNAFTMTRDSDYQGPITSDFIEVDTNKKYYESINSRSNNSEATYYEGIIEYDIDKNYIEPCHYLYTENTLTYLSKDLKDGDSEIYLNSLEGFNTKDIREEIDSGLIFWNYKDSTGYEYPELTYSRNVFFDLFNSENDFDLTENKIILKTPWNHGNIEKGVKVSQCLSWATYNYGLMSGDTLTNEYKHHENYIEGVNEKNERSMTKFRPATKYIKILMLINYNQIPNVTTDIKNVIFAEMD